MSMLGRQQKVLSRVWRISSLLQRQIATERIATHPMYSCPYLGSLPDLPVQQDDVSKDFYMEIVNGSLQSAYEKCGPSICTQQKNTGQDKSVVVVGAGVAGLAAAFELEKVGYTTRIVELQHRVGGRTKTLRDGFSTGLHAEGGAMRIPPNHYLTNGYIQKFGIPVRNFVNYNAETWLYLNGETKIKTKDWMENNNFYSSQLFPGWNCNIPESIKPHVKGILDLYDKTMQPVKDDLYKLMQEHGVNEGWANWVEKWSKLSVDDFLRSNIYGDTNLSFRPWPEAAIRGYQVGTYSPGFGMSLVEHLRDELGKWWQGLLHTPVDGMDTLAKTFIKPQPGRVQNVIDLAQNITFGTKVRSIKKTTEGRVKVTGRNTVTGRDDIFTADTAIITLPLTILRQMDIDLNDSHRTAVSNIHYEASTKIILQCRSRFWEHQVGQGGFSKTDLPIGQLHYPSQSDPRPPNGRGLLVCYTWGQDAQIFGSQTKSEAIESAVREISKIHPEIKDEFEVGMVQAWFTDDTAQGAYASLNPFQYNNGMKTLMTPEHPIYLAGEAISYTNGWIQGALESGLNAAYHLYSHNKQQN